MAQRLSPRSTRRLARMTGLNIVRALASGSYVHSFVTADHRHGHVDIRTSEWNWDDDPMHWSSCPELFAA